MMRRLSLVLFVGMIFGLEWSKDSANGAQPDVSMLIRDLSADKPITREKAAETLGSYGPAAADAVTALAAALKDSDPRVRHEVLLALEQIGPAAQPAVADLQAIVEKGPASMRLGAIHALGSIGEGAGAATDALVAHAKGDDPSLATAAVLALVRIHPGKAEQLERAVPLLVKSLGSKQAQVRNDAAAALGEIGAPAIPALVETLGRESTDPAAATQAAVALAIMGPQASGAVAPLTKALKSKNDKLSGQAAFALGSIGAAAKPAVSDVTELLSSKIANIRANAANALGQIGDANSTAIAALGRALADSDANVRREAAQSLGEIGPGAKGAVAALVGALHDDEGAVTLHAAEALGRIGPDAIPALVKGLDDKRIRSIVILILADMGPAAKPALSPLVSLVQDKDLEIRREALIAIAQMGPAGSEAIPALLTELKNEKSEVRPGAIYALVKIGADEQILPILTKTVADKNDKHLRDVSAWGLVTLRPKNTEYVRMAIPHLINGLGHDAELVQRESIAALGRLGSHAKVAAPDLARIVAQSDKSPAVRNDALAALGEIGADSSSAVAAVLSAMSDPAPMMRYTACYALGKIGSPAKEAVPALLDNLKSKDPFLPIISAWSLVNIDPKQEGLATLAVPLLTRGLKLPEPQGRIEAIKALQMLGAQSKPALADLEKLASDPDEGVRKAAAAAIRKIKG